jgi:sugar phosphate isomerase/epimerase
MKNKNDQNSPISRRKFIGSSAVAATALTTVPLHFAFGSSNSSTANVPNSKFGGVQIGTITYSWRDRPSGAADILQYCREAGVSSLELMGDVIETYAGIPASPTELPDPLPAEMQTRLEGIMKMTSMNVEQMQKNLEPAIWKMIVAGIIGTTEEQKNWRLTVPMSKFEELRKMYLDAGVDIHIAKLSPAQWSDGEIDYAFKAAKALGAKGITEETGLDAAKRLAPFAEKHGMYAIMHNHFQFADKNFNVDEILAVSPSIMMNFDCGHYFGSTGLNPAEFIKRYHNRIFSLHIKDKTGPKTTPPNENQVWGQGEVPLAEVLLLLKQHAPEEGWPKYADIELEYPVPAWSTSVKEVKTCVAYARQILI